MKAVKWFTGILVGLVVLIAVILFFVLSNLNSLIKTTIESVGTQVLETNVSLGKVEVDLSEGYGSLNALSIKNPPQCSEPYFLNVGKIALHIDPGTLTDEVITIEEIALDGADLTLEHIALQETNVQILAENVKANTAGNTTDASATEAVEPVVRFWVKKLVISNTKMNVVSPQFEAKTYTLKTIQQSNLGDPNTGLTAKALANAILTPILNEAKVTFENEIKGEVKTRTRALIEENLSEDDKSKVEKLKSLMNQ